jgi:hypothetical protein
MTVDLTLIVAFLIGVLGTARVTRLIAEDDYPPALWLRELWIVKVCKGNAWSKLIECPFCLSPYIGAVNLGFAWLSINGDSTLDWWWWIPNLWLAGAYLAASYVARDIPPDSTV